MTSWVAVFWTLLILGAGLLREGDAIRHHILTKSWDEAQDDCLAYLRLDANSSTIDYRAHQYGDDAATRALVFCIVFNLRTYEPSRNELRLEQLSRFFRPDSNDADYLVRTNECLRKVPNPSSAGCGSEFYFQATELVFEAFYCFYRYYGHLHEGSIPLPPTALELEQAEEMCAQIVSLPEVLLKDRVHLRSHPLYGRFRECVALRTGVFGLELTEDGVQYVVDYGVLESEVDQEVSALLDQRPDL